MRLGVSQLDALLSVSEALEARDRGRELALKSRPDEACFLLSLSAMSFEQAGERLEAARTWILLAWAQDLDGRSWQAARTLKVVTSLPEFGELPRWVRTRALGTYSRALWALGDYQASLEKASEAYALAEDDSDRGRAALSVAQAALQLGRSRQAEETFQQALLYDPSLEITALGVRAYLANLAGKHHQAMLDAQDGLKKMYDTCLENIDNASRAAEYSALLVESCTAKAFLGLDGAYEEIVKARELLSESPGNAELELARTSRAMAMVLARDGECAAASALLAGVQRVFSRRGALAEHGLTSRVVNFVLRREGIRNATESSEAVRGRVVDRSDRRAGPGNC
jgi:tetratricopeptide (TPR) repeat protein